MPDKPPRNVRLTFSLDIHVPDATDGRADHESASPAYAEHLSTQCSEDTHERASALVHEVFEAGDPDDALNAVLVVQDSSMLKAGES